MEREGGGIGWWRWGGIKISGGAGWGVEGGRGRVIEEIIF